MVIQDGGRYQSLIRDVIVRLALVYFTRNLRIEGPEGRLTSVPTLELDGICNTADNSLAAYNRLTCQCFYQLKTGCTG